MRLFHRTNHAAAILRDGFLDGEGQYMTDQVHRGVWLSNVRLDINEGANGDDVLEIYLPDDLAREYEWVEEGKPYREFPVPAALVNRYGPPRLLTSEEIDVIAEDRFGPRE
jgi:hypothetical protein